MSIKVIALLLIGAWAGAELAFYLFYSPKARIKSLWKRIHKLSSLMGKWDSLPAFTLAPFESERNKMGRFINALLDYNFDPEEDREYIEENRYTDEIITHEENIKRQANRLLIQDEDWGKIEKLLTREF